MPAKTVSSWPALSPLDGRYRQQLQPLALILSEENLVMHRVQVELRWLLHLSETGAPALAVLAKKRSLLQQFSDRIEKYILNKEKHIEDIHKIYSEVKELEQQTRHDVKAVEYWLRAQFIAHGLEDCISLLHFGCTSEDINSPSWALMMDAALEQQLLPSLEQLHQQLAKAAVSYADIPLLARTHGQPASPTTLGKEIAVFCTRLQGQLQTLKKLRPIAKFSGATGNYSAHSTALPKLDWPALCCQFIQSLGLEFNSCTTQIEAGDRLAEICHCLMRINRILTDLARDCWGYLSLGYLCQQKITGEIGSSTMPHKVNPIDFENAEGNMAMAHAMLEKLASDLTVSRWQRDLSGSTLQRNLGAALGHCQLAWISLQRGMERISPDQAAMERDLNEHWEVLLEAVQTCMRLSGDDQAYEKMRELTQSSAMNAETFRALVQGLPDLDDKTRARLLALTPKSWSGQAQQLARLAANGDD